MRYVFVAVLLVGCAFDSLRDLAPQSLAILETSSLCRSFYDEHLPAVEAELRRREAFTDEEWTAIGESRVFVGMSLEAVICSYGEPSTIRTTTSPSRISHQYVYRTRSPDDTRYVYIEYGTVTDWRDY